MTETKSKAIWTSVLAVSAVTLAIVLAAAYLAGVYYFRDHFPFHASYRGHDISERGLDAIAEADEAEASRRVLVIRGRDGAERTYVLSEWLGYTETAVEPEEGWLPSPWLWFLSLRNETVYETGLVRAWDPERISDVVKDAAKLHSGALVRPRDAYMEQRGSSFRIVPETEGNILLRTRVRGAVQAAAEEMIVSSADDLYIDLDAAGAYAQPQIRRDDPALNTLADNCNALRGQTIEIDLVDRTETLTMDDIFAFYTLDDSGHIAELDTDAVYGYAAGLKEKYDTYERETDFINSYGETIRVGTWRDTYGFKMDLDATASRLAETISSHESRAIEPVWTHRAKARCRSGSDAGDTYIEISIDNQRLWAYRNGECILSSDVVTGNAGNHDTPRGEFYIICFGYQVTLTGDDYESFVTYWMPITERGVGLHDASWRSSFGGSIYRGNGSHGCINLPYWAARELYWTFTAGTPVIIW